MPSDRSANQPNKPKLLNQVRTVMRLRRMSYRTEEAYTNWIERFIVWHGKRHPSELGEPEIQSIFHFPSAIYYLSLQRICSAQPINNGTVPGARIYGQ